MSIAPHARASLAALSLLWLAAACSSTDDGAPQEPVAPESEQSPYDDPDMQKALGEGGETPPSETPPGETPPTEETTPGEAAPTESTPEDLQGELTEDPLGAPKDVPKMKEESGDMLTDPPPAEDPLPPTDSDEAFDGAFDEGGGTPEYEPAPESYQESPEATTPHAGSAPRPKSKSKSAGKVAASPKGKVTRYVNATLLNVRSAPRRNAKIVRRLLGGAKIYVERHGSWSKIKDGQWVRASFLSAKPTKKVSAAEADAAWGNTPDVWKKGHGKKH